jgi:AraC-like DNA-binding protein
LGQDYLEQLSYEQLKDSMVKHDFPQKYIDIFLNRAKSTKDSLHIAKGFYHKTYKLELDSAIIYCDSIIAYSKHLKHHRYPAAGYILKGYYLYLNGQDKKAYENFLIAYEYALKTKNIKQQIFVKNYIGTFKNNIGQYENALKIFREQYHFIKSQPNYEKLYESDYSDILGSLANSFLRGKVLDSAYFYINEGLSFSKNNKDKTEYKDFLSDYANYLYLSKEYDQALDSFKRFVPFWKGHMNLAINYYYQGKIYQIKNDTSKSIDYFLKIDSLYNENQVPFLEHNEVYKTLYDYYYKHGNKQKQLYTINKLIEIDSVLDELSYNINTKSTNDYEIPKLKAEKEKILQDLNQEHTKTNYIIASATLIALVLILVLIKLYLDKKQLKARFESIIQKQDANSKSVVDKAIEIPSEKIENTLNISQEVIDAILEALTQFEHNKGYLDNQITLAFLAKQFSTNSVYLSKVINHYKGMSLSNYLSNLRIEYCITELRENSTLRNYTIKAIALEMGFRNAESFSKAFKKQTGLNPSYYIKELNKLEKNSQ